MIDAGELKDLARGIAWRLVEAGGLIGRDEVRADLAALSPAERRTLRELGVRIGAHSVWLPAVLKPGARQLAQAFTPVEGWAPGRGLTPLPDPPPSPAALSARGLRAVGRLAAPVELLERLAERLRAAPEGGRKRVLTEADLAALGLDGEQAAALLAALRPGGPGKPRTGKPLRHAPAPKDSPFAALAALKPAPARRRPRRKAAR